MAQAKHLWIPDAADLLHGPRAHFTRLLRRNEYEESIFQEPQPMRNRINLLEETVKKNPERYVVLKQFP